MLLTHYRYKNDLKIAQALSGVDVIVDGDSHTLLGSAFAEVGLRPGGEYPTMLTNKDGDKVSACSGTPPLLLADSFKRKNGEGKRVELAGKARSAATAAVSAHPYLRVNQPDQQANELLNRFRAKVDSLKSAKISRSETTLCLERIPGQGKSKNCDIAQTASHGRDRSNAIRKAFLRMRKTSNIAVQSGGGVRVGLLEGDITIGDAYTLLPFANTLTELTLTGTEIKAVFEQALDYALSEGGSTGAYPYAAGLRWHVDMSKANGKRFSDIEVNSRLAANWTALGLSKSYKVVTNSYIALGKDGYKTFRVVSKRGDALNTYLDYAQSFVNYVLETKTIK